jgi:L-arabinose transport system ATP-binding protein
VHTLVSGGPFSTDPAIAHAEGTALLDISHVSKAYGGVQALTDVSIAVQKGEVLAIVGENGAGKSTLVGIAAGRVSPDAGTVTVESESLLGPGPMEAIRAGIRLVPQELLVCPDMSVLDNVLLGQRPTRLGGFLDRPAARREALRRLHRLGVADLDLDIPVGDLTLVLRTFVQIARNLSPGARVVLIDEPTAPMDDSEVSQFFGALRALTREGLGIVYISHRLKEVFQLAQRVAVLRDGRLVAELVGDDMTYSRVISAMVGGRNLRDRHVLPRPVGPVRLRVRDLTSTGLENVGFDLHAGEILVVYGISGSGRETLGQAIVGALPRRGSVEIDGVPARVSVSDTVAKGVGYVPPERRSQGLDLKASVVANLTTAVLHGMSRFGLLSGRRLRSVTDHWIRQLAIRAPSSEAPVVSLSGGSQQKVLLARWLAARAEILVLEEPTRGVDVATKAEIYRLLDDLSARGSAILVITSDIEEAAIVGQRALVMRRGRIAERVEHPTEEALASLAQAS